MQAREKEPMDRHTSFRAGGLADYFVEVEDEDMLRKVLRVFDLEGVETFLIGNGSNLLVSDRGYHGAVILLKGAPFRAIARNGSRISAGAGATLSDVTRRAAKEGLTGLVQLSGIPGTIGGALTMNAGAFGQEMKDVVETVRFLDLEKEGYPAVTAAGQDMGFGYRTSIARQRKLCFLETTFLLSEADPAEITEEMALLQSMRREKQPLEYPSAGSAFKRPEGHFAGQLIMEAGLKGHRVGGAEVAEKHCGFIINRGGATASDIHTLMQEVKERVLEHAGVELEPEIILLGDFT